MTPRSREDEVRSALPVLRGLRCRCPACGRGRLFGRFLKSVETCEACGTELHHHRADDFPPYIVMFVVGHIVGYAIFVTETRFGGVDGAIHMVVWPALALLLSLGLLQPVKGAVIGLQFALGMHGFGRARAEAGQDRDPHSAERWRPRLADEPARPGETARPA